MSRFKLRKMLAVAGMLTALLLPARLSAEVIDGIKYKLDHSDLTASVVSSSESASEIIIPEKVTYNDSVYSVTSVGDQAFAYCSNLRSLTIASGESSLAFGKLVFDKTKISSVHVGRNFTYKGRFEEAPFYMMNSLKEVTIGDNVTSIGDYAFERCTGIVSLDIPNSVTSIGHGAFVGCTGLISLRIGESVTSIGGFAFKFCSGLTSLDIPDSVQSIGESAFAECTNLRFVKIGDSITSIGLDVFAKCGGIKELTLGKSLSEITAQSFSDSYIVKIISNAEVAPTIDCSSFSFHTQQYVDVQIPEESKTSYQQKWSSFRCFDCSTSIGYSITVTSPGNLINQIPIDEVNEIKNLKLAGKLNGTDLLTLNKCLNLQYLDLTESSIVSGGMPYYEKDNDRFGTEDNILGEMWCYNLNSLSFLKLPSTLVAIGKDAFYGKENLLKIDIPTSIDSIGERAFHGCSGLVSIDIPYTLASLPKEVFKGCSGLLAIEIPTSIQTIDQSAFWGCLSLTSLEIPSQVTSIGKEAFSGCSRIKQLVFSDSETALEVGASIFSGVTIEKLYLGRDLIYEGKYSDAPFYNQISLTDLTIGHDVTVICQYGFYDCSNLNPLVIPNSVTTIGQNAFNGCSALKSIVIPNSVSSIGQMAFKDCFAIKEIIVEDDISILDMDEDVFSGIDMTKVYLGRNINYKVTKSSYGDPFYGRVSLVELTIGTRVTSIGEHMFEGCSGINSVEIPMSVTSIGREAFKECLGLNSVVFSDGELLLDLGVNAFYKVPLEKLYWGRNVSFSKSGGFNSAFPDLTALTGLTIGANVIALDDQFFVKCPALKTINMADAPSVLYFGKDVFSDSEIIKLHLGRNMTYGSGNVTNCPFREKETLSELTIGRYVTSIDRYAFYGCSGLNSIELGNSLTKIGSYAFEGCISLPSVEIPNSVVEIGISAFKGCIKLTSVQIPPSVTEINVSVFEDCIALSSVEIPTSVTTINDHAFENCASLESIDIPASVTEICQYAFKGCRNLTSVKIPNSVNFIRAATFQNCESLTSVEIPNSVTIIERDVFSGCTSLTTVDIPNSVYLLQRGSFDGCTALRSINLPPSLTGISNALFRDCKSLTTINIPDPVKSIGEEAFSGCEGLTNIILPGSIREIGKKAFYRCSSLDSVTVINPIPPVIESNTFSSNSATLVVPEGSRNIYWIHPYWGKFSSIAVWNGEANDTFKLDNLTYRVTSEIDLTAEVTSAELTSRGADIIIPEEVEHNGKTYRVSGIANNGLENVKAISVSLPATIGYVGLEAFKGCESLKSLDCNALTPPSVYSNSFDEPAYTSVKLGVPEEATEAYQANSIWGRFSIGSTFVPVTSIELDPESKECVEGDSFTINATVYPLDATYQTLEWTSSDESVAMVDQEGTVTVLKAGSCVITAKATDGSDVEATCTLDVNSSVYSINVSDDVPVEVYTLSGVFVKRGDREILKHLAPGVYIIRQGNSMNKVMVK